MSPPTPETISIIVAESGSRSSVMPTSKLPVESHVQAVETYSRSSSSWPSRPANETRAPPKETATESVEIQPAVRRSIVSPMTASAKIWPSWSPCRRANEIRVRLAAFSMISSESSTMSGLRRSSTPNAPIAKRTPAMTRYQETSGPSIGLLELLLGARARAEDDAADRRHEQHDRRDLEGEQVVGQEDAT